MSRGALRSTLTFAAFALLLPAAGAFASAAHDWFLKARAAELSGDDGAALDFYRLAFRSDGRNRELCFLYLDHLKAAGSMDSSRALAKKCADLPGEPRLSEYKTLGEIALRGEDPAEAIRWYRAALALDEDDGDALYVLAGLYENERDWKEYAPVARRLLPRLNYPATLVERQLLAYSRLDQPAEALSLLEEAWRVTGRETYGRSLAAYYEARGMHRSLLKVARTLAEGQSDPEYQWLLARAYAAAERPDSAMRLCEVLLRNGSAPTGKKSSAALSAADSANQGILYLYAYLLFDAGRYKEAYAAARKLLKVDTADAPSLFLLGSAALEMGKAEARGILEKALALLPLSPDYRSRLAYADYVFKSPGQVPARLAYPVNDSVTLRQSLLLEGFAQGQLARQLDPRGAWERPSVYSDSGAARRHRLEAVARFEKVLALDSGGAAGKRAATFELASHLDRLGERDRAESLLRGLIRQDTANAMALNYLGYMLVENLPVTPAQLDESGRLLDRALVLEPENGAYLDSKGWWQYRAGALDSARITLESATESIPADPAILGHLAEVLRAEGRVSEACALDRDVRRLDPDHAFPGAACADAAPRKDKP